MERVLDAFEMRHPQVRVVRLRPGFVFKRTAASGIYRLFAGPWLPTPLLRPGFIPVVPRLPQLRFQAVHSLDVDLLLAAPLMDTTRARDELGWRPRHSAAEALREVIEGMRESAGADTPPLHPTPGMTGRLSELGTGVGATDRRRR